MGWASHEEAHLNVDLELGSVAGEAVNANSARIEALHATEHLQSDQIASQAWWHASSHHDIKTSP